MLVPFPTDQIRLPPLLINGSVLRLVLTLLVGSGVGLVLGAIKALADIVSGRLTPAIDRSLSRLIRPIPFGVNRPTMAELSPK